MQFPKSWLHDFVDPNWSADQLSHELTMLGLEVESERPAAPAFTGVVVARVRSTAQHPNADKLKVCEVDHGSGTALTIVCGAPNVAPGMQVACARVGAVLPPGENGKPFVIGASKLGGVDSAGMLCSARELGLSQDHAGLMALATDVPLGTDLRSALDLDDVIYEIKLTPDKGHCLCIAGIAREVAAGASVPFEPPIWAPVDATIADRAQVTIADDDLCGRFAGRIVRGVDAAAATPAWLRDRLERCGLRSISALVDISNYVMLELGQPSHVFDLDQVAGAIVARWAREGESLTLLNGQQVTLAANTGVVADQRGPLAIAGIMGGQSTMVGDATRNVFIEAAFWWPDSIRGRAKQYGISTDAGHRFERGVDFMLGATAVDRITRLVIDICGGQAGPIDDVVAALPERAPVAMRVARAARIIGMPLTAAQCTDAFDRLGLSWTAEGDVIRVMPPSRRFDIEREEDLVEEVARIIGFESIPVRLPAGELAMRRNAEGRRGNHDLRRLLAGRGYQETINYSFVDADQDRELTGIDDPIRLLNPIVSQMSVMRAGLASSLLPVLSHNLKHRADRVFLFEIGRVFRRNARVGDTLSTVVGIDQPLRAGGLAFGAALPEQWGVKPTRSVDFFDVKADVEALCSACGATVFESTVHPALHPGRAAQVSIGGKIVGWIGELHPRHQQRWELPSAPILFELDVEPLLAVLMPDFQEVARYPVVRRDLAFVIDQSVAAETVRQQMLAAITEAAPELVSNITLFDEYRGKGLLYNEKSLAFRIVLQDTAATLLDERVDSVTAKIVERLSRSGAQLRR
ncbi:phenylalanine--tRNA ligase subunit beta [soil metagenome]